MASRARTGQRLRVNKSGDKIRIFMLNSLRQTATNQSQAGGGSPGSQHVLGAGVAGVPHTQAATYENLPMFGKGQEP